MILVLCPESLEQSRQFQEAFCTNELGENCLRYKQAFMVRTALLVPGCSTDFSRPKRRARQSEISIGICSLVSNRKNTYEVATSRPRADLRRAFCLACFRALLCSFLIFRAPNQSPTLLQLSTMSTDAAAPAPADDVSIRPILGRA